MRGKRGVANVFLFSSLKSPWLTNVGKVLREFDPLCEDRMRVHSSNPVKKYTAKVKAIEHTALEELNNKYDFSGRRALALKRKREEVDVAKVAKKRAKPFEKGTEFEFVDKTPAEMATTLQKLGVEGVCKQTFRVKDSGGAFTLCENRPSSTRSECSTCWLRTHTRKPQLRNRPCLCDKKWGATQCWNRPIQLLRNHRKGDPQRHHCSTCRNGACSAATHAANEAAHREKYAAKCARLGFTVRHVAPAGVLKVPGNRERGAMLNHKGEEPVPGEVYTDNDNDGITWKVCPSGQECKASHGYIAVCKIMGKTARSKCSACSNVKRSGCYALTLPNMQEVCRRNAGLHVKGWVNGVAWWMGMCCNGTCAGAIANALREHFVDKKALPEMWSGVVPSYRTTSKPDTVVADAYSQERIAQRLKEEGTSSSSSSSETIILPPEHMDDMEDE